MGRNTPFIITRSGIRFYPFEPTPDQIDFEDIAHSLSMTCRWGGYSDFFYSVAEHSIRVGALASYLFERTSESPIFLFGLLHDATESYLPDVARPIKPSFLIMENERVRTFKECEDEIHQAIWTKIGVCPGKREESAVKTADDLMLFLEAEWLGLGTDWLKDGIPDILANEEIRNMVRDVAPLGMPPEESKSRFLEELAKFQIGPLSVK